MKVKTILASLFLAGSLHAAEVGDLRSQDVFAFCAVINMALYNDSGQQTEMLYEEAAFYARALVAAIGEDKAMRAVQQMALDFQRADAAGGLSKEKMWEAASECHHLRTQAEELRNESN